MTKSMQELIDLEISRNPELMEKFKRRKEEEVNSFSSAFKRGVAGTKKAMFDGLTAIGTAVEQKTGEDSTVTDFLQDVGKRNSERQQSILQSLGTPTETTDLFKIKSFDDAKEFTKQAAGTATGSLGFQLGLGTAARFGVSLLGFTPAGRVGKLLFNMLPVSPLFVQGIGSVYKSAIDKGASDEEAAEKSIVAGLANGLIDTAFVGKILSKIYDPIKTSTKVAELTKKSLAGSIASDTAKLATTGAVTEGLVAANTEIASDKIAGRETDPKEVAKRAINDAAIGTIGGTAVGPVVGTSSKLATDALIEQNKESDEFIQLAEKIKEEDVVNANIIKRTTAKIEVLENRIKQIDKAADVVEKRVGAPGFFSNASETINKLKDNRSKILDEYKAATENSLPQEARRKRIELKNIDNEIKQFEKSRQGEIGYSKKAGKLKAALQKRINEEKVKLNKAKEKGEMKGELLITPELLSGTSQTGISGVISKIYDGSIIQRLLGRATSPIRRTAINNYREKGDTRLFRVYNNLESFYPESQNRAGSYLSPILEAVKDLQPIARTGARDIASLATFGLISESPATSIKNQKLLYESLSNKKGYILEKYGQTSLAKKVDKADTEIRKVLKQVYDDARDAGIDVNYMDNYVPIRYILNNKKNQEKFKTVAKKYIKNDNEVNAIVENINDEGGYYLTNIRGKKKKDIPDRRVNLNLEKTRKIPKEMVEELRQEGLVDDNILEILPGYMMRAAKDIEFENRFKNVELTMKSLIDEGLVTDKEYNAVGNTLQAIQGKYGTQVPKGFARGAYQFALANAYFLTLPFAALTALSEPLILLARAKPGSALVSAIKLPINAFRRTARIFYPRLRKSNTEKAFQEIMYGLDGALTERITASSTLDTPRKFTNGFFKTTMLTQVTQLSRQMAFDGFKNELKTDMSSIVNGNLKGTVRGLELRKKYQEVGIPDIFKLVDDIQGKPFDKVFRESALIKAAAARFVDQQIMTPNPTNRPLWMSSPALAGTAQLKSFAFVFGNTVGFRLLKNLIGKDRTPNQRTASLFRYGVAMSMIILVSMYTDLLKEMFRSASSDDPTENLDDLLRKKEERGQNYIFDVIAGTNIAGGATSFKLALDAARYGASPLVSILLGPIGAKVDGLLRGISKATKDDPSVRPLVRELVTLNPVFAANRGARDKAVDLILGNDSDFDSYEDFSKKIGLDKYTLDKITGDL